VTTAIVTLSAEGLTIARALSSSLPGSTIYAHASITSAEEKFSRILALTESLFRNHDAIVYIAPCGVVVRAVAPYIDHKTWDPAVVVVDAGGRHAVSLLSGHEGGANRLAVLAANAIDAEPVISTTSEATKNIIIGIGCRKNTSKEALVDAVRNSLAEMSISLEELRLLATADIKRNETGLIEAADVLGVPLLFVSSKQIRSFGGAFEISTAAEKHLSLPAVAEPACMLAGKRTSLIMRKKKCNGITIAMARESCLWSA
jgi:cobalt-precorrin 5A hydrolase